MEIVTSPMIIGDTDFGLSIVEKNKKLLKKLMKRDPQHVAVYGSRGGQLYKLQSPTGGYVFGVDDDEVIRYFVRYEVKTILGVKAVRQIYLWRDPTRIVSAGLTKFVFYKILLPVTGVMVADREQTNAGKEFWLRRISESLTYRRNVYIADQGRRTFTLVHNEKELDSLIPTIWGSENRHLDRLPVITNRKLKRN